MKSHSYPCPYLPCSVLISTFINFFISTVYENLGKCIFILPISHIEVSVHLFFPTEYIMELFSYHCINHFFILYLASCIPFFSDILLLEIMLCKTNSRSRAARSKGKAFVIYISQDCLL